MRRVIGISFAYARPENTEEYGWVSGEAKFTRIERVEEVSYGAPKGIFKYLWKHWELSISERRELANKIIEAVGHRPREIDGFTLFWNGSRVAPGGIKREPAWQMSIRRKGEIGWSIGKVTQAQAEMVFSLLKNSGHPDGPWDIGSIYVQQDPPTELETNFRYRLAASLELVALLSALEKAQETLSAHLATLMAPEL